MGSILHQKIRHALENTPGLTQKGLAERMGLNPAAVNRMLYGRRHIRADEIPVIEDYLGIHLDLSTVPAPTPDVDFEYRQTHSSARYRGLSDVPQESFSPPVGASYMVPVYGAIMGQFEKGFHLNTGTISDWVPRHPAQFGIKDAFALYVSSESMEPRYFRGELIYVHPGRPPESNKDCVIELNSGEAFIKRFLRQAPGAVRVVQFNPPEERDIPKADIKTIYMVVGRG